MLAYAVLKVTYWKTFNTLSGDQYRLRGNRNSKRM